jgi:hypothetical protein
VELPRCCLTGYTYIKKRFSKSGTRFATLAAIYHPFAQSLRQKLSDGGVLLGHRKLRTMGWLGAILSKLCQVAALGSSPVLPQASRVRQALRIAKVRCVNGVRLGLTHEKRATQGGPGRPLLASCQQLMVPSTILFHRSCQLLARGR